MKWTFNDGTVYVLSKEEEKKWKRIQKWIYKKEHGRKPLSVSPLCEKSRFIADHDDWESCYEYGFLKGTGYTDEELDEIRDDMWLRVTSPYDCSGQRFTRWIEFHRNPSGLISYVHSIGIDV